MLATTAVRVYKYMKIQEASIVITRPFAYNESLQHPTIAVLLIKILIFFRPLGSVHLFQSNQLFQAMEFLDRHVSEKL